MLPLAYRSLGDSFGRKAFRTVRTLSLPALVTAGLAWVLGRAGGPLLAFTETHGRVVGLTAVAGAGITLMIVFYALLLVSLPPVQRQQLLARCRVSWGRLSARAH